MDAVVAFDRVAPKYGLELLSQHPLVRAHYAKFTALSVLPTQDQYAVFDILGGMGKGLCTPQDLVVAHCLYPNDAAIDFVYRTTVGDDYRRLPMPGHSWNNLITCGVFATSHHPEITPEKLKLPLSFFCGQRALMMARSSWDRGATMLTMHVRGASGGHPYPDRNGIMFAGQGRAWVTIPGKDIGAWACNTVLIDGAGQTPTTPGRVVDYVDTPNATFMVGDAKYCWDWVWRVAAKNRQGADIRRDDVLRDNVDAGPSWRLVDMCFNDFAHTKSDREIYCKALKLAAHWLAPDGVLSPYTRQVNMPVLKAFRTAGIVRGPQPYVLVVDDIQRDAMPARYDWNITLAEDVVEVGGNGEFDAHGDILLAGKASLDAHAALKPGEPALLVRVLACEGRPAVEIGPREKDNLLSLHTTAPAPALKILLYAFRAGDPLPKTAWDAGHTAVSVEFPEQKDVIRFAAGASGKTDVAITRGSRPLVKVDKPVVSLADADSDALTSRLKRIPGRVAELRQQGYNPAEQPGFVAGWDFDQVTGDGTAPLRGSVAAAQAVPLGDSKVVEGIGGRRAVAAGPRSLVGTLDFAKSAKAQPFTIACWVKTKVNPWMGGLVNVDGIVGSEFIQGGLRVSVARVLNDNWPSTMLSSWTHLVFTCDGKLIRTYRNGAPVSAAPLPDGAKYGWGKKFSFGGKGPYGDAEVCVQSICLFDRALDAPTINDLYLCGRSPAK
jgi:hypothetical protein